MPMVPLGQIAAVKLGKMLDRSKHKSGRKLPYLRNINVRWGTVDTTDLAEMFFKDAAEEDKYSVRPGDVLVCEGGEPGRASVWAGSETELKYQKALHRVRFREPYEPKLLVYFLEWMASTGRLEEFFTGSTIKHFTREAFVQLPVPNPPLPEQRRIVARIEELFSRLDAGVAALRHAKAQLQRYRQSVLAAAVTGQLTQAWREQHPDIEPASALRRCLLETRQLRWTGKYHSPVSAALEQSRAIPESWAWMSADELIREPLKNGLSLKGFTNPPGVAVLKLDALNENGLDYSKRQYLRTDSPKVAEIQIEKGDFLISRGNGSLRLLAKGVLADVVPDNVIFPDTMIRFRFPSALQRWISVAWRSRVLREQIEGRAKSTAGIYKIAQGDLRPIAIPIPPLAEQHQIVAEVEARTTAIDHLEAELDRQITRSNRLRQSVLGEALRGGLK